MTNTHAKSVTESVMAYRTVEVSLENKFILNGSPYASWNRTPTPLKPSNENDFNA